MALIAKKAKKKELYLEVKAASYDASSWGATFNDTTVEKAKCFKDKKLYLALAVWKDASDLLFVCFGQNEQIGEFLEKKVKWFKEGHTVRSTQTISFKDLIKKYGFKICVVNRTKDEVKKLICKKYKKLVDLPKEIFIEKFDVEEYIK